MVTETRRCLVCQRILTIDKFAYRTGYTCKDCRAKSKHGKNHDGTVKGGRDGVTKTCRKCGKEKPLQAFLPGFDHCRACQRERREQHG